MDEVSVSDKAWILHVRGLPPSEIAERLGIPTDQARREITAIWRADRERYLAEKRAQKGGGR